MSVYANTIVSLNTQLKNKQEYEKKYKKILKSLEKCQSEHITLTEAQQIISTVSDDNMNVTLDFITGIINKALQEIFPKAVFKVYLEKKLFAGSRPHINLKLEDVNGYSVKMKYTGTGVSQIVSVLFSISLIEIRKGRRIVILDERLSGLHKEAKRIFTEILKIFTDAGFQFIFVEYGLNDLGKIYNVENIGEISRVYPLEGEYDDTKVYYFTEDEIPLAEDEIEEED